MRILYVSIVLTLQGLALGDLIKSCTYFEGKEDCCHNLTVVYKGENCYDKSTFDIPCSNGAREERTGVSFCDKFEKTCQQSCNKCGEESYLTATRTVETTPSKTCTKLSLVHPYSCIEEVENMEVLPNVFLLHVPVDLLTGAGSPFDGDPTTCAMEEFCVSFDYRRRFGFGPDVQPVAWSDVKMCAKEHARSEANTPGIAGADKCMDSDFTSLVASEIAANLTDTDAYRDNNCWKKLTIKVVPDCTADMHVYLEVIQEVDWLDIDNVSYNYGTDCPGTAIQFDQLCADPVSHPTPVAPTAG